MPSRLVPVIVPVAVSPAALIAPPVIVPNEMLPGWSFVSPAPPSIMAVTVPLPALMVALFVISAVPLLFVNQQLHMMLMC